MDPERRQTLSQAEMVGFEEAFQEETRVLLGERFRLSFKIGIVLYLAFSALDWVFAREYWASFLFLRVFVSSVAGMAMYLSRSDWGKQQIVGLSFFTLSLASLVLSIMTSMTGGWDSNYFYGNMLVVFLVGLFMPWRPGITLTFCSVVACGYFISNLWVHQLEIAVVLPFFFLLGTCALTTMGTVAIERGRRKDLWQRIALEDANGRLQELDESKTRFFANVSHELRTPLMLILGPLESMLSGKEKGDPKPLLNSMNISAHRLLRQVNMVLNFAKLEAGAQVCEYQTGNVGGILSNLVVSAEPLAETRAMRLEFTGLDEVPNSLFDHEKIETIASNLISNALKFTPNGGRVSVRAGSDKNHIWFEVEDTGRGIPLNEQAKVFERFHQVQNGPVGKIQGTGLGLSLSREFVRMHGGDMSLKSAPGVGSTFRVELPLEPPPVAEDANKVKPAQTTEPDLLAETDGGMPATARLGGSTTALSGTAFADLAEPALAEEAGLSESELNEQNAEAPLVLVVEDNDDMRAFISRSLRNRYRVETAVDGEDGLRQARRLMPDLIVSDVMMPRLDGFGMLKRLRESKRMQSTPVIMVTARTGSEAIVHGLDLGAVDYVTKPFKLSELEARIEAQLRMVSVQHQLDERESRLAAVGQMTGQIAHDLRSPLTSIGLRIDVMLQTIQIAHDMATAKPLDLTEDLDVMKSAVGRATGMVGDMVEFLRGEEVHLDIETVPLYPFLRELAEDLQLSMEAAEIELVVEVEDRDRLIASIDRERMRRVLQNLVSNAQEAMTQFKNARGNRIWLQAQATGEGVVIRIADNGPGIPAEIIGSLFQPFATAGKAHGTGLGLAIVRNLVTAHRGEIKVEEGPPEGGAAFKITLPSDHSFWEELAANLPEFVEAPSP
jgi:signal transduction histidine kinase